MKNDPNLIVKEDEFGAIEMQENKLRSLNDEINNKGVELERIVR